MTYQYVNKQETMLAKVKARTGKISDKTHEEHLKIYAGCVNKANSILKELEELAPVLDPTNAAHANPIYSSIRSLKVELNYALGGIVNHELYFTILGGPESAPQGALSEMLLQSFGSREAYDRDLKATALCARGWVWTGYDTRSGRLFNYLGDAHDSFPTWGVKPILALDTYEHAYFADFHTARAAYVDEFIRHIDWAAVNECLVS